MQRHRLPSKPFCKISGVGSTPLSLHDSRAAWQATTNPGVQNPHCRELQGVTQRPQSQETIISAGMAGPYPQLWTASTVVTDVQANEELHCCLVDARHA